MIWHAWRACVPQGTEGSNPSPSATIHIADGCSVGGALVVRLTVLDGEVAVPCTRNPL